VVSIKADVRDVAKLADSIESMTMRLDAAAEKIATQAGLIDSALRSQRVSW